MENTSLLKQLCWVFVVVLNYQDHVQGDTVHMIAVTSTPFGASQPGASFSCLLSEPDTTQLNNIKYGRQVLRGPDPPYNTLDMPQGTTVNIFPDLKATKVSLPTSIDAHGMYYCEVVSRGIRTRIPIAVNAQNRRIQLKYHVFTIFSQHYAGFGGYTEILETPSGSLAEEDLIWEKQSNNTSGFQTVGVGNRASGLVFPIVTGNETGVYALYWKGRREDFRLALMRIYASECPFGKWNPPLCAGICDLCYNGGLCDPNTGECVCPVGFFGPNCITACNEDRFGVDCQQYCHCADGIACDRFTGECAGPYPCEYGWSGSNCQIPDNCPPGYHGYSCLDKNCENRVNCLDGDCLPGYWGTHCELSCINCLNENPTCDRDTGCEQDTFTGLSLCKPRYMATRFEHDNCERYSGCFADCTQTCHCAESDGTHEHICDSVTGECATRCRHGWWGESCQTGIVSLTNSKANPGEPINVTCIVTGDEIPTPEQVELYIYAGGDWNSRIILEHQSAEVNGKNLVVRSKATTSESHRFIYCAVRTQGSAQQLGQAQSNGDYYVLPVLSEPPTVISVCPTLVILEWDAWDRTQDIGDGPIVGYNIYYKSTSTDGSWFLGGSVIGQSQVIRGSLDSLNTNTSYTMYVTVVREGPRGEGLRPNDVINIKTLIDGQPCQLIRPSSPPSGHGPSTSSTTTNGTGVSQDTIKHTAPFPVVYVIGGSAGFVVFVVLISAVIFCRRCKTSAGASSYMGDTIPINFKPKTVSSKHIDGSHYSTTIDRYPSAHGEEQIYEDVKDERRNPKYGKFIVDDDRDVNGNMTSDYMTTF